MNKVVEVYNNQISEDDRSKKQSYFMEFYLTEKYLSKVIKKTSKVLEVGCATGYYAMQFHDKCKQYIGLDIVPKYINDLNNKVKRKGIKNVTGVVGDATDVHFEDNSFDVVLLLGPMYHLDKKSRDKAILEAKRVCKPNGVIVWAYLNKVAVFSGLVATYEYREVISKEILAQIVDKGQDKEGIFHYSTPEEQVALAGKNNLEVLRHIGLDGVGSHSKVVKSMTARDFKLWAEFVEKTCELASSIGANDHALLITRNLK
jgi:ubiquinone/menaquinone biosynthesis C-methylase UbiE